MITGKNKKFNNLSINSKVGRNINRVLILNSILEKQPISRVKISKLTGLNKSTVSSIVTSLIDEDLIIEEINRNQEIGRNPFNLRIKKGQNFVGAIYFDSLKTEIAIVDVDGDIKCKEDVITENRNPVEFVLFCINRLKNLQKKYRIDQLKGVGISVAGIVDSTQSKVIYAPNLGWQDLEIGKIIHEQMDDMQTITIENDAKASALAELTLGKHGIDPSNFVFLSVGPGIGAGIVVDNHILSGSSHAAGEFGHMTIIEGGELCSCGNRGCWEMYASDRATIKRYALDKGLPLEQTSKLFLEDVIIAANMNDKDAQEAFSTSATYIGLGIANIIRSFDPEVIIIGGAITQIWDVIYPGIIETVNDRGFFGKQRNTTILPTSLSGNPPLLGAASLSIRKIFTDFRIAV